MMSDKILVKDLHLRGNFGVDCWNMSSPLHVVLNLTIYHSLTQAAKTDSIAGSIDYAAVTDNIVELSDSAMYTSLEEFAEAVAILCIGNYGVQRVKVRVETDKGALFAGKVYVEVTRCCDLEKPMKRCADTNDVICLRDLTVPAIIGLLPFERLEKQQIISNITLFLPKSADTRPSTSYQRVSKAVVQLIESSRFLTLEALATSIAKTCLESSFCPKVTVEIDKPCVLPMARCPSVEITRDREFFGLCVVEDNNVKTESAAPTNLHTVYLAFGTNVGDLIGNVRNAIKALEQECSCTVIDTSFLYETAPMYVTDQPSFLNGVCKVVCPLEPEELLSRLKHVEQSMGRQETRRNGPRIIDLDIIFYDDIVYKSEALIIPHQSLAEREFVLRPLNDIAPNYVHPILSQPVRSLLSLLPPSSCPPRKIIPIRSDTFWPLSKKTYIMGILNVTPDSFSDGGRFNALDSAYQHAMEMVSAGADIIDIGGQSTRPNAEEVSVEEEINRVVPVIKCLRDRGLKVPISVDTFRSRVASAAIESGADLINDVSGGTRDPEMLKVMSNLNVPVCLMHMRGDSKTMMSLTTYDNNDVIEGVRKELKDRLENALKAGIHRWNILLDPGIGFSKSHEQNFEILKRLKNVTEQGSGLDGMPLLVGTSRKGFIGKVIEKENPKERVWGTASTVAAAIAGGATVVRVHDVKEMNDVVKVADKIWK
ncbi:Dihydropteroate synthase-like protein [Paraphysoderma sedebokerense]|nr:Dihydropteroate synthase-like protein [Paraphysoderma sedebokerense]